MSIRSKGAAEDETGSRSETTAETNQYWRAEAKPRSGRIETIAQPRGANPERDGTGCVLRGQILREAAMSTLSFPKSTLRDPAHSQVQKLRTEPGCGGENRECRGYRDEPHEHLVVTGYSAPATREELKALWAEQRPSWEPPTDDDIDKVIASQADLIDAGPWRYFYAATDEPAS
jgi:hypothetical protein